LAKSGAWVDFTQGLDARLLTEKNIAALKRIRIKMIHFAMDSYGERHIIADKLRLFKEMAGIKRQQASVYILCNYNTALEQDLERIELADRLGFNPFVMLYNKEALPAGHELKRVQRWANNKFIFNAQKNFYKYKD
jgi:hypothetical protein